MLLENFKEHLALSVRSIQWSYAIFWSTSSTQPGRVLSWGEGYYNGDIKTRKTSQGVELNFDQIGLQRSEQLRELYKSLKAVEASPQTKRRSAALSPEDLTDTECEEAGWDVELKARGINNKHTLAYQVRRMGSKETALIFMHEEYKILKRYKNYRSSSKRAISFF
ncbi:transcription factor EGL1-like isoform X3 [Arachis ipaensis]|uniref:transcription factor EGL1-like isoform X3 n=1 Tax=Arachis ipaensis TaxID=130454 RepID=UPI000A2B6489|nr:transcription factor EGL1-like isoform X3 [Arachis ipaensis]XP_025646475.1 transcription factor EGL1 isoform X3 [Arachis hypogaea]